MPDLNKASWVENFGVNQPSGERSECKILRAGNIPFPCEKFVGRLDEPDENPKERIFG